MTKIDKAIILAAGMGKRIAGAGGPPKPLLPLDDSGTLTFLDWHLRALAAQGVREIYLVGSKATFGTKLAAMEDHPATWIMNDFPGDISGSGHSTHLAFTSGKDILDGKSRVVLMDADVVYDPSVFADLASGGGAATPARSKTLVCGRFRETDEEVMVFADERGVPRLHGKGLLHTPMVRDLRCLGEATGLLLLEPNDPRGVAGGGGVVHEVLHGEDAHRARGHHGTAPGDGGARRGGVGDETRCMECDTPDEYEVVRREMVPRWVGKLPR